MANAGVREQARAAALARWSRKDNVDARVDALAESIRRKVDALPPLTAAQRSRLAAVLRSAKGGVGR